METTPVILAIDVGYGNTKFVTDRPTNKKQITCSVFPSLTPRAAAVTQLLEPATLPAHLVSWPRP
jgi:hypothetical protein